MTLELIGARQRHASVGYRTVSCFTTVHTPVIKQRMFAPVLLQDLPSKTSHRLLRSVTWIEVDAAFPAHIPLRKLVGRVAHLGQRSVNAHTAIA
jgi:hypothetical protein